jgi:hypothetical protein
MLASRDVEIHVNSRTNAPTTIQNATSRQSATPMLCSIAAACGDAVDGGTSKHARPARKKSTPTRNSHSAIAPITLNRRCVCAIVTRWSVNCLRSTFAPGYQSSCSAGVFQ